MKTFILFLFAFALAIPTSAKEITLLKSVHGNKIALDSSVTFVPRAFPPLFDRITPKGTVREVIYNKTKGSMELVDETITFYNRRSFFIIILFMAYIIYIFLVEIKYKTFNGKIKFFPIVLWAIFSSLLFRFTSNFDSRVILLGLVGIAILSLLVSGIILILSWILIKPPDLLYSRLIYLSSPLPFLLLFALWYTLNWAVIPELLGGWIAVYFFVLFLKHEKKPKQVEQ